VASELSRLLSSIRGRKLVVVGDLVADHYVYGQNRSGEPGGPGAGGPPRGVRGDARGRGERGGQRRALGAEVTAVGVLGRDEMGEAVRQRFAERGIRVVAVDAPFTETKTGS
jgi:bifunctional ADP-heptose synthase (sugar kinase/adenylyltransferase)